MGYWADVRDRLRNELRTNWQLRFAGWVCAALGASGIILVPWLALEGETQASVVYTALCFGGYGLLGIGLLR